MNKILIGAAAVLALTASAAAFADPAAKEAEEKCHEVAKEEAVPAENMQTWMEECMEEFMESEKVEKELDK